MDDQGRKFQQTIAKCWVDEAFKQRLLADPAGTLMAEGVEVPGGIELVAVADTPTRLHILIPREANELSDDQLDDIDGGVPISFAFPPRCW